MTNKIKYDIIENVKMMVLRSPQRTLSAERRAGEYRSCSKWSEMNSHNHIGNVRKTNEISIKAGRSRAKDRDAK